MNDQITFRMTDGELQILRSLIGLELSEVYCPYIRVLENHFCAIPTASIRFTREPDFVVVEVDEQKTLLGSDQLPIECRPRLRKSSAPDSISHFWSKEIIVGPCSIICVGPSFQITSVVVLEYVTDVDIVAGTQTKQTQVSSDKQITFYSGEARPLSIWSANSTLYVSRDLGLLTSSTIKPQTRLVLK